VSADETARAFVDAALANDAARLDQLAAPDARWTTPKGSTYALLDVVNEVAPPEDYAELSIAREGHRYESVGPGRVLVLYDTVYRWKDGEGLSNRVPSGYVVDVEDGRVTTVRAFLDEEKARAAAGGAEAVV
jgi:ketosteroid isomerase-like protein